MFLCPPVWVLNLLVQIFIDSPVQTASVMRLFFNPFCNFPKPRLLFIFATFFCSAQLHAQECTPPENFEAVYYDHSKADYQWDYAADAQYYILSVNVNKQPYTKLDLPGSATATSISFKPFLKHNDRVHAVLTKYCGGESFKSASFDFIIIDDAIVYLTGSAHEGHPTTVEPVSAPNDNLVPAANICGRCDPAFFRLEAGFYGPYRIAVDSTIGPIEHLRFLKTELCTCLDNAIAAGVLDANGGPGPFYTGKPFHCALTPYVFDETDCTPRNNGGNKQRGVVADHEINQRTLEITPNPATGVIQIRYQLSGETNTSILRIFDLTGQLMRTVEQHPSAAAGDYRMEFDAGALAPGFYSCQLQAGGECRTAVLVVGIR